MLKVLIIDDEPAVRAGLKAIIDWDSLGYEIIGEAADGHEGLRLLIELNPDLCITDIKMPGLYGTEMLEKAREGGFGGKVIILTGYSDFEYARSAIKSGVSSFQLKPIEEDDLLEAIIKVRKTILSEKEKLESIRSSMNLIYEKQLTDFICGKLPASSVNLEQLKLCDGIYRVAVIKAIQSDGKIPELFANEQEMHCICIDDLWVVLIWGSGITRFSVIMPDIFRKMPGLFASVGRQCSTADEIHLSYTDAKKIQQQSFYYQQSDSLVLWDDIQEDFSSGVSLNSIDIKEYIEVFYNYIEIGQEELLQKKIHCFESEYRRLNLHPDRFAGVLSNIFIRVRDILSQNYHNLIIPDDARIIHDIYTKQSLHEITDYILSEFLSFMKQIGNNSRDNIVKRLCIYIEANYAKDLKLESLAKIFCYNSSYLGRIFRSGTGESFNSYLDHVRIRKAKEMLAEGKYKVYEISYMVGYKNIDYFYRKFKYYVGRKPRDYWGEMSNMTTRIEKGELSDG
ncbi:two component transcriptional regulator, AraC family [Ruminiclostridium cellulolyticum H10]|uniref:Stage 0 sporulation protein A homolog n=2 Tax=Ruminiclostridium cellulolyticum TaxID=1521 RepID=B8I616_RUMCH|nr:two component transcriptional regulator, AraC family [Ruminiclostridium cellulolyticum H10]